MKKLFSLFLATTALWASSESEYIANKAMRTTPLMIVPVAQMLPLYAKTIMSSSGTKGYDIVLEGHLQNGVNIENLKDENGPVTGKMVISSADLPGVSSKLNILGMTPLTDLHITGCSGYNNQYFKKISDNYRGLNLSIIFTNDVKWIVDGFLSYCPGLTTLDLSPLSNVTSIDYSFLSGCTGLTTLDLSPLLNVTSIGSGFLSGCTGLTTLDLSGFSNVTIIGFYFLSCCTGLKTLDLSGFSNVTIIRRSFLSNCPGLTTLDLSPLLNVTSIDDKFLSGCTGLTSVTVKKESLLNETLEKPEIIGALPSLLKISIKD